MKKLLISIAIVLSPVFCAAAPPTDVSIMRLFKAMETESMIDSVYSAMEPMIQQSMAQATAGRPLTEEQKNVLDSAPQRMGEVLRAELNWQKMLPLMMDVYRTSFDQAGPQPDP